jgi:RNA polymerase sigma-70 factor (ECF subfamily)
MSETNHPDRARTFERLVSPLMPSLYRTSLRLTRNHQDAQDLVQDVYLRAFRFFHQFEPGTNFRAWIFRILMNTFINRYRKQKRLPSTVQLERVDYFLGGTDPHWVGPASFRDAPLDLRDHFDDRVKHALDKMPREFRAVVILADVEGMSYKEIASTLKIPMGTVMSRLSRGRKQLQRSLARYAIAHGYIHPAGLLSPPAQLRLSGRGKSST